MIAKKYTKAILESFSNNEVQEIIDILSKLNKALEDKKVAECINSPFIDKTQKEQLILSVFDKLEQKFENLLKVLVASDRICLIPEIIKGLEKKLLADKKQFVAILKIKQELDSATLQSIAKSLSTKLNANLDVRQEKASIEGIRLSVEDLGVEIAFSKERFLGDLTNHILKAI
ncbi:F0F1 ATP synthase subunit delta [Helicobacter sp. 23-1048]